MLKLKHYEPLLASAWRTWIRISRFISLILTVGIVGFSPLWQAKQMFKFNKRFWATNEPRYLSLALSYYFKLKAHWVNVPHATKEVDIVKISGWANSVVFKKIIKEIPAAHVRRVFRPDVWYLHRELKNFYAGFEVLLPLDLAPTALDFLVKNFSNGISGLPSNSQNENLTGIDGKLESLSLQRRERGVSWYSCFNISPREFTSLVEAAADKEIAALGLDFFQKTSLISYGEEVEFCMAKFCLILGEVPPGLEITGWDCVPIISPTWEQAGGTAPESSQTNVSPRHFEAHEISVINGGILVQNGSFLNWDRAQHPRLDFVAGNSNYVIGSHTNLNYCFLRNAVHLETVSEAILLGSRVDSNWFHFLIETLPRLFLLEKTIDERVPILVSDRVPSSGIEALSFISKRSIRKVSTTGWVTVQKAHVPGPVIFHPDTQFFWGNQDCAQVNFDAIRKLASAVLEEIKPSRGTRLTFWERSSRYRYVTNAQAVRALLRKLGFVIEDPSKLNFRDQVNSIYGSRALVAVGGALMSNFIFAAPETKIILLVSNFGKQYAMPRFLSNISNSKLFYVGGRSALRGRRLGIVEKSHLSFRTNLGELKANLREK